MSGSRVNYQLKPCTLNSENLLKLGNEETPHAQPIPSVTVGYGGDWMSLSPIALHFWVS